MAGPGDDGGDVAGDAAGDVAGEFVLEDITPGVFASGFGHLADGRRFAFRVEHGRIRVEIYRPRSSGPVPLPEDVVATASRGIAGLDLDDVRTLSAAVRDAIASAEPVR